MGSIKSIYMCENGVAKNQGASLIHDRKHIVKISWHYAWTIEQETVHSQMIELLIDCSEPILIIVFSETVYGSTKLAQISAACVEAKIT